METAITSLLKVEHGFVNMPDLKERIGGALAVQLCDCGYILPSLCAIDLQLHKSSCQYRRFVEILAATT